MRPYDPKVSLRGHESLPLQCPHFHFREKSRLVPVRFVQSHAFFLLLFADCCAWLPAWLDFLFISTYYSQNASFLPAITTF